MFSALEGWLAAGPTTRSMARTFERWAVRNLHLPGVEFPCRKAETRPVLDQNERLRLLRETLDNHHIPLHHRASAWFFPGYRPGRHLHPGHRMKKLRQSGIHLLGAGNATLRALVLTMPPPVAARALGCSTQITEQHAKRAGDTWATYASYRR